jgi:outer membrane protein OmpA-like peptidoglycan-associated protein
MIMKVKRLHGLLLCLAVPTALAERVYISDIHQSVWQVANSEIDCRLSQEIPGFGSAVFQLVSGANTKLTIKPNNGQPSMHQVIVNQEKPSWKHDAIDEIFTKVSIQNVVWPLIISDGMANDILRILKLGNLVNFTFQVPEKQSDKLIVGLNPIGFQSKYRVFSDCQKRLIPLASMQHTILNFASNAYHLTSEMTDTIRNISTIFKEVDGRYRLQIDGHTDNVASRAYNLRLSGKRVDSVVEYLISQGIPSAAITKKSLGEQYPKASNKTENGRAANRRIEIEMLPVM